MFLHTPGVINSISNFFPFPLPFILITATVTVHLGKIPFSIPVPWWCAALSSSPSAIKSESFHCYIRLLRRDGFPYKSQQIRIFLLFHLPTQQASSTEFPSRGTISTLGRPTHPQTVYQRDFPRFIQPPNQALRILPFLPSLSSSLLSWNGRRFSCYCCCCRCCYRESIHLEYISTNLAAAAESKTREYIAGMRNTQR